MSTDRVFFPPHVTQLSAADRSWSIWVTRIDGRIWRVSMHDYRGGSDVARIAFRSLVRRMGRDYFGVYVVTAEGEHNFLCAACFCTAEGADEQFNDDRSWAAVVTMEERNTKTGLSSLSHARRCEGWVDVPAYCRGPLIGR